MFANVGEKSNVNSSMAKRGSEWLKFSVSRNDVEK